ncbi:hypothetical protein C488_08592 [Natrinema pellirubrum DSM 15624]|uniref:Uncharacterized protein n=1 Tax=Natrinema pellirubrum (strain DSM 15624 / CIP 106293 / JCM 10476 / NCIMB 786 / 157) TaxID=797303 RepID=L0JPB8_NATP1|nr:hypothetical protein [Natrinema pellirubrum]AGB32693.1 hypothetical protein Natpe_2896 [Natrinema pellirubrum DSM 15624]ELY75904.1 hypothetical protein C488_08592 [Natrinema pellirubrum DSM 15624]
MAGSTRQSVETTADDLFDKYTLPKIALTIILAASFLGTVVTGRLAGSGSLAVAVAKWGYFVALGVLAGGLLWKHGFVSPGDLETGADAYCARMYDRFHWIAIGALVVLVPGAAVAIDRYAAAVSRPLPVLALGTAVLGLVAAGGTQSLRSASVDAQFRGPLGLAALALALAAVVLTAALEVGLRAGDGLAVGVRVLHLLAFAVWVGGAVWNIFVAVPTGQEYPTTPVIRAAGQQLERFRWAVRFIIPTLIATGLYQAVDALGTTIGTYLGTTLGLAVAAKLGSIGVLVVIFKLCPMWRACSPIDGVCDLEEMGGQRDGPTTDAAGPEPTEVTSDD